MQLGIVSQQGISGLTFVLTDSVTNELDIQKALVKP